MPVKKKYASPSPEKYFFDQPPGHCKRWDNS